MLKITRSSDKLALKAFKTGNNKVVKDGGDRTNETIVDSSKSKNNKFEKSTYIPNIGVTGEPIFLTLDAKKAFNYLRQAFIKAPILRHFDLKSHIWIGTNALGYAIDRMLS